ncbi:PEP-utilizing enzyme [Nanoarchaeota archaeon]
MNFKEALKEKWYAQGFNVTPINILAAAGSGFIIKQEAGIEYTTFLMVFKEDYGDMHYYAKDLKDLGIFIENKLKKDNDYFVKLKKIYKNQVAKSEIFFKKIEQTNLKTVKEDELISLLNKTFHEVAISVGVGHVIEPFALTTDIKIKQELEKQIKDNKELNKVFTALMAPVKKSFINEYEESLKRISKAKDKEKLIENHIKRFFWIKNTYAGRHIITKKEVMDELKSIKEKEAIDFDKIRKEKRKLIDELKLKGDLLSQIKATEFLICWQDERKEQIMLAIDYLEQVLEEVARRLKFDIKFLRYLQLSEFDFEKLKSKKLQDELRKRRKGSAFIWEAKGSKVIAGEDYDKFVKEFKKEKETEVKELGGTTASTGTAIGKVKVCTTLESMKKVNEGDILVASMTRPEFVPAMKKAAAIITDEGGITCHAAIVSRELNIPCIIGTRTATKVLKDGDLVEVRGNHGVVKVIKKK